MVSNISYLPPFLYFIWTLLLTGGFLKVKRAKENLDALPGDFERCVTALEKKAKDLEKSDGTSAKSKEKMLRELLNNI